MRQVEPPSSELYPFQTNSDSKTRVVNQNSAHLVGEIAALTQTLHSEVEYRLRMEVEQLGWNVNRDVKRFHVCPHQFDDRMATLYRDGDGFIYETIAFWMRSYRQQWTALALERIRRLGIQNPRVLLIGDGCGNDSLYLSQSGISTDYYDIPGSVTFDFAVRRFEYHDANVNVVSDRSTLGEAAYDAVLSFEVLEHLPDPIAELKFIAKCLRDGGIALVTEAFSGVTETLPTHLKSNLRYVGRLPFMCADAGLCFSWHGPDWKPWEFVKRPGSKLRLRCDPRVQKFVLFSRYPKLWSGLRTVLKGSGKLEPRSK